MTRTKSVFCPACLLDKVGTRTVFVRVDKIGTKSEFVPDRQKHLYIFIYKWGISLPSKSRERSVAA